MHLLATIHGSHSVRFRNPKIALIIPAFLLYVGFDFRPVTAVKRIEPCTKNSKKMLQPPNVLEHSLENRETVECISQFAMLLRVCNRQSP